MAGLFDMPSMGEIRVQMANEARAKQAQFANQAAPPGAKGVGAIVGMLGKAFGAEDPRLTQARKDEKIIKDVTSSTEGIDFSKDPSGAIMEGASKFYKAGKIQQALQLWTTAQKLKTSTSTGLTSFQKENRATLSTAMKNAKTPKARDLAIKQFEQRQKGRSVTQATRPPTAVTESKRIWNIARTRMKKKGQVLKSYDELLPEERSELENIQRTGAMEAFMKLIMGSGLGMEGGSSSGVEVLRD